VLAKEEKKNHLKKQNRKKIYKSHKKSVHFGARNWRKLDIILEKLSQLIGASAWCESNAKSLLRN